MIFLLWIVNVCSLLPIKGPLSFMYASCHFCMKNIIVSRDVSQLLAYILLSEDDITI